MKQLQSKDSILPVLAILLSIGSLALTYDQYNIPSALVSCVGILAGVMYFSKHKSYRLLIQVWIYGQFPAFVKEVIQMSENGTQIITINNIFNAGQLFKFPIGMEFGTDTGTLELKFNLVTVVFLSLFRMFAASSLIEGRVVISNFRLDSKFGEVFPLTGTIVRNVQVEAEENWFLAELESELKYNGSSYRHLLLMPKDKTLYKTNRRKNVSYALLVKDAEAVQDKIPSKKDYPFVDWVIVQVG